MGKDRSRKSLRARKEGIREERKITEIRELLTFNFKNLIQNQPPKNPETVELWQELNLITVLVNKLRELSKLTRNEACHQQQIKIYGDFPAKSKTDFILPDYFDKHLTWGVIEGLGGLPRVAGYMSENTFYIVFLDSKHKFWKSEKKHT